MLKRDEISQPGSCLNRARDDEYLFVLLGRDEAMANTIEFWIKERIRLGKNKPDDEQLLEAAFTAEAVRRAQNRTAF